MRAITPGSGKVAIGSRLAETLGAYVGSEISLISPEGRSTAIGTVPRIVSYQVGAIFEVGVYDYDKAFVVMPMQDAQTLLMLGDEIGMIEVQTNDPDKAREILAPLGPLVQGRGVIVDWQQMNSALFEALEIERVAMFVVLSLIVLVAVFNILSSLIMLVRAKTRDIAILRTMGASRRSMMKVFVTVGVTIGSLGIVLGDHPWRDLPLLPAGGGGLHPVRDRPEPVGSVGPIPLRIAVEDRSVRGHGNRPDRADPVLPRDSLSGVEGGEHRSCPGAAL